MALSTSSQMARAARARVMAVPIIALQFKIPKAKIGTYCANLKYKREKKRYSKVYSTSALPSTQVTYPFPLESKAKLRLGSPV